MIRAVAIGWNRIDHAVWGSTGYLPDCELDADNMAARWRAVDIPTAVLKTKAATRSLCRGAIRTARTGMVDGDTLIVSVSGHGGQKPDKSGDEADGLDEYLCAYDGPVTDDTIADWFAGLTVAIRIIFICDTCHSGTMGRALPMAPRADIIPATGKAKMILMSGCTEAGTSDSTGRGGRWTNALCAVSPRGRSPRVWFEAAAMLCRAGGQQEPQWAEYGSVTDDFRNGALIK